MLCTERVDCTSVEQWLCLDWTLVPPTQLIFYSLTLLYISSQLTSTCCLRMTGFCPSMLSQVSSFDRSRCAYPWCWLRGELLSVRRGPEICPWARVEVNISLAFLCWVGIALHTWPFVFDIAIFVLKRDVKLQLAN